MSDRRPAEVFPVGEYIRDELTGRGWTYADLAGRTGMSPQEVEDICAGVKPFLAKHAVAVGRAFGTGEVFWLNLNHAYLRWSR
jgi:HTH-type transcriptional regulator/antitoxin HigA